MATHFSRRVAARAILEVGGSFPQPSLSGQWRTSAFQLYLNLGREDSRAVASMLTEASDGDWIVRRQGRVVGCFEVRGIPGGNRPLA